jgi:hypothetical protein
LGIFEESILGDIMRDFHCLLASNLEGDDNIVNVHSKEFYEEIKKIMDRNEVYVETKYKTVAKMSNQWHYHFHLIVKKRLKELLSNQI